MPLYRLQDYERRSQQASSCNGVRTMALYTAEGENVGKIADILVNPEGHYRYLIINLSLEASNQSVLLPVSLARFDYKTQRVYVDNLARDQIVNLPKYNGQMTADGVASRQRQDQPAINFTTSSVNNGQQSYNYQQDPDLYNLNRPEHQTLKLYEEKLIAHKSSRVKSGEVAISKQVKTESRKLAVPVIRERVVVERLTPADANTTVNSNHTDFQAGEIVRIELYDDAPVISKEAFVREEVKVKKIASKYLFEVTDTVRREELDLDQRQL